MKTKIFLIAAFLGACLQGYGSDTLYFRLSSPWNSIKDPAGVYIRKAVIENDYYHTWDYNPDNILVAESFFADTFFKKKLLCHKYFNPEKGWLEQSKCYTDGRLDGYFVTYDKNGDTVDYDIYVNGEVVKSWTRENPTASRNPNALRPGQVRAEFPGGRQAWLDFLYNNLQYPSDVQDHIVGQVVLRFVINPKGRIENIEVVKSLHPSLDQEAIRVVLKSPRWKPSEEYGEKTQTVVTQPINFQ